jgi:hypothetical protein
MEKEVHSVLCAQFFGGVNATEVFWVPFQTRRIEENEYVD